MLPRREKQPAFFLDRDGVLIEDVNYLAHPEQVVVLPGVEAALRRIREAGYQSCVVTNQAGVARGFFDLPAVQAVHAKMDQIFAASSVSAGPYYVCPHHPEGTVSPWNRRCECRKPSPGLLLRAADDLLLDLPVSFLIGDKLSDLQAGATVGCRTVLVRTGHGRQHETLARESANAVRLVAVVDSLLEAVEACFLAAAEDSAKSSPADTPLTFPGFYQDPGCG